MHDKRLDEVAGDAEHYIEMDLGLGVLTGKSATTQVKPPHAPGGGGDIEDEVVTTVSIGPELSQIGETGTKKAAKRKIEELG